MPEPPLIEDLRQQVVERARGCCEYCRSEASYATHSFSIEHILISIASTRHWPHLYPINLAEQGRRCAHSAYLPSARIPGGLYLSVAAPIPNGDRSMPRT